jgi:hypothetical protein
MSVTKAIRMFVLDERALPDYILFVTSCESIVAVSY